MNLIEQLGGYERVKAEFEALKNQPELYKGEHAANDLLLLQYRRANNIFEVGDWVVETSRHTDNQIYKIKEDHGEHCFYVGTNGGDRDFWTLFLGEIRHATSEEIKAGHRL